ncbi:MAG: hypothetical protein U5J83_17285 [Bryobacterales bacterium]|nr:hypothetical protein [Bryobacterales bacterium]
MSAAVLGFVSLAMAVDPKLLSMLPAKSEVVGGVNVRAIMGSGLAREFMKSPGSGAGGLAEFTAMTGVDIERDIHEVIFAGYTPPAAKGAAKPASTVGLGFITGSFDAARIGGAIVAKGGTKSTYKGQTLFKPAAKANKDGDVLTFLDGTTMVAGNPGQVKQVLDKAAGGLSTDILARVNDVGGRYDVWMVSTVSPGAIASGMPEGAPGAEAAGALAGDFFKKVESTQGGIKLGPTINIGLEVISSSPEDAAALMNVLGFFRSMMGSQAPKQGEAAPPAGLVNMLNAIKMRTEAKTLFVSMAVPEADVISFMRSAQTSAATPKEPVQEEIIVIQ